MVARLAASALVLVACGGVPDRDPWDTGAPPACRVVVTPATLAFDLAASDAPSAPRTVQVVSDCPESVVVSDLTTILGDKGPEGGDVFRVDDPAIPRFRVLGPGDVLEVPIVFDPPHGGGFEGRMALRTSPDVGTLEVRLEGRASGPTPDLTAEQAPDTRQWCASPVQARLTNAGPDALPIEGWSLGDEPGCDGFDLGDTFDDGTRVAGTVVPVGGRVDLPITFTPVDVGPAACTLSLHTTLAEPVTATLRGRGLNTFTAEERFRTSDGSGAQVLLLADDRPGPLPVLDRLEDALPTLLADLRDDDVDFRITALSTATGCAEGQPPFGTRSDADAAILDGLADSLRDPGTAEADRLLSLLSVAASRAGTPCLAGWFEPWEPVHAVLVSGRDDASPRRVDSYVDEVRFELTGGVAISTISPAGSCAPAASRLPAASRATAGLALDACAADWTPHARALAAHTAELRRPVDGWILATEPLPGSVRVALDDQATTDFRLVQVGSDADPLTRLELTRPVPDGTRVQVLYADVGTCR